MERKIVTSHVNPPIPARNWDWCAHYDGEEEAGNYGWGRTEAEAIQDFKDYCADAHDSRLDRSEAMQRWAGETGMVPVTGKERPMLRPEAASTEARFESASLHQSNAIWPNWGDRPDGFDGPTGAE